MDRLERVRNSLLQLLPLRFSRFLWHFYHHKLSCMERLHSLCPDKFPAALCGGVGDDEHVLWHALRNDSSDIRSLAGSFSIPLPSHTRTCLSNRRPASLRKTTSCSTTRSLSPAPSSPLASALEKPFFTVNTFGPMKWPRAPTLLLRRISSEEQFQQLSAYLIDVYCTIYFRLQVNSHRSKSFLQKQYKLLHIRPILDTGNSNCSRQARTSSS